jgi:hypothetical protein
MFRTKIRAFSKPDDVSSRNHSRSSISSRCGHGASRTSRALLTCCPSSSGGRFARMNSATRWFNGRTLGWRFAGSVSRIHAVQMSRCATCQRSNTASFSELRTCRGVTSSHSTKRRHVPISRTMASSLSIGCQSSFVGTKRRLGTLAHGGAVEGSLLSALGHP